MVYAIIIGYLLLTFGASLLGRDKQMDTAEGYFLAGRNLGPIVLFFTFIATNFSAFFFLGFAGQGYKIGYAYYVMMAFGTAFAALSFYFIGFRVWLLGKAHGYITPPELIGGEMQSDKLRLLYLSVMVFFTLPYLALQPIGAGYLLNSLTDGAVPYFAGAVLLTLVIVAYIFIGGMKSVALTDVKQGILMFVLMFAALIVIASNYGGIQAANEAVFQLKPELFSRGGGGGYFSKPKWFSMMLLWICCVPMLPQLFMRFYISRDLASLKTSTILYSLVPTILFICPVAIGVIGHLSYPDLVGKQIDQILPLMLSSHAPEWLAALIMTGALAAFMSTLDSQLLALGTMLTRDVYARYFDRELSLQKEVKVGKAFIAAAAVLGLLIAYHPPDTIFAIAKQAFTGLAVLFPTTVAVLHWKKTSAAACIASILIGEVMLLASILGILPKGFFFGCDLIVLLMLTCALVIIIGSFSSPKAKPV